MSEKKAIVLDTNFIIQNKALDEVIDCLKNDYIVYVTQVSIDERIAQRCRELKKDYESFNNKQHIFKRFADISINSTYEETCEKYKNGIQNNYIKTFEKNIIPIPKRRDIFNIVYTRSLNKVPPFSTAADASDKGLKDSLLWISINNYFEKHGEKEIVILTDDKGFLNNVPELINEFKNNTGKDIDIKPNKYYNELISSTESKADDEKDIIVEFSEINDLREEINNTFSSLCEIEEYDYYGNIVLEKTFTTSQKITGFETVLILFELKELLKKHIFSKYLSSTEIFGEFINIIDTGYKIPISNIENAYKTYEKVQRNYKEYIDSFFDTVTEIFNNNYISSDEKLDDVELPF